jgi:ubiquinone/menaquinone biosynthesis C-methylase UbiE
MIQKSKRHFMGAFQALAEKLSCPVCTGQVQGGKDALRCEGCQAVFPVWGDFPWVFANAGEWKADWTQRFRFYLQQLHEDVQNLKMELKLLDLLPKTRERLQHLVQAKTEQHRELEKLFEPLLLGKGPSYEQQLAAQTPLPEAQQLMGYYGNVLRDWGWGEEENQTCEDILAAILGPHPLGTMLVLGTGPSRLAYDIHRRLGGKDTIAVDINPFYLLVAERMLAGRNLNLYEFPIAPTDAKASASRVKCRAPETLKQGFSFLMADAMNPCFQDASVDTLLTPWLIDIVPQDFRSFAKKLNRIMKPGARWLNFGSTVFHHRLQHLCYSREEIPDILAESGFEVLQIRENVIPYLRSPSSCQQRSEKVFTFMARKVQEVAPGPAYTPLPNWLSDTEMPVPIQADMQQQMIVNLTLTQVLAQVDGQKNLRQIAEVMAPTFELPASDVLPMLKRMFGRFVEGRGRSMNF